MYQFVANVVVYDNVRAEITRSPNRELSKVEVLKSLGYGLDVMLIMMVLFRQC